MRPADPTRTSRRSAHGDDLHRVRFETGPMTKPLRERSADGAVLAAARLVGGDER
jgi:hypothetical protein